MHCSCDTNNRAPQWTFTNPCKPEVRPDAREESASPAWLASPAMDARDTTKVYIWRLDTGCGPTLYRKYHSHSTPGKRHYYTWVEPLARSTTRSIVFKFHICIPCNNNNNNNNALFTKGYSISYKLFLPEAFWWNISNHTKSFNLMTLPWPLTLSIICET